MARHEIVIGVPFKQDIRNGPLRVVPPVERSVLHGGTSTRLMRIDSCGSFAGARLLSTSFVGLNASATNVFSTFLMDLGGNPWGSYDQQEPCMHCGARAEATRPQSAPCGAKFAHPLRFASKNFRKRITRPHGNFRIHLVFSVDRDTNGR